MYRRRKSVARNEKEKELILTETIIVGEKTIAIAITNIFNIIIVIRCFCDKKKKNSARS